MRYLNFFALLLLSMIFPAVSCSSQDPVHPFLRETIKAHGGHGAIEGASRIHAKGRIRALFLDDQGTYEYWFEREGRKLRVETRYARHSETRLLEGSRGMRAQGGGGLSAVSGFRYEAMLYQFKHIDLLFGLMNGAYEVEDRQEGRAPSGRTARVFGLRDREGTVMTVYLDPSGGTLMAVSGSINVEGRSAVLSTEFYDYREVGDCIFPFRLVNYASGSRISETTMESYDIGSDQ